MDRVPLFSPPPAFLEPERIAGTSHDSDDPVRFASDGKSADTASAAVAPGTSRDPRDWRARRQARRFRMVVKRSRRTGLYGLLDYASRRAVADGLTLDQLEDALGRFSIVRHF
jgi:hypothetical protein